MRIGLKDIDAEIAAKVAERLLSPLKDFLGENIHWKGIPWKFRWQAISEAPTFQRKREPNSDERAAYESRCRREDSFGYRIAAAILIPLASGLCTLTFTRSGYELSGGLLLSSGAVWAGGTALGTWWALKARPQTRLSYSLSLSEMRAVFPHLALNRAERVYCDALLMMVRTQTDSGTERTFQEIMLQLNTLLQNYRQLDQRRQSLLPIMGMHSVADLEREFGELGRKLDTISDTITRNAVQQSLEMCSTRLENARQIIQNLERLQVQQDAIVQTLASALSAMARMQTAPVLQAGETAQEIAQTVSQMNQQTWAVEKAVEEVMTIGIE